MDKYKNNKMLNTICYISPFIMLIGTALFTKWWGQVGYIIGYILLALSLVIAIVNDRVGYYKSLDWATRIEKDITPLKLTLQGILFFILFALGLIIFTDIVASFVSGHDCYLIFGGYENSVG